MSLLARVLMVFLIVMILVATANGSDLFGTVWFDGKVAYGAVVKLVPGPDHFVDVATQSGYYSIRNIPAGDYSVNVEYQGKGCVKRVRVYPQRTQYNVICP